MANGTIAFDTLQTSGQITGTAKSVDTDYVVNGSAKVWTQTDGTGTVSTRDSFNLSSLTDNATGDYTQTFSNAMNNNDYSPVGMAAGSNHSAFYNEANTTTTSFRQLIRQNTTDTDSDPISLQICGDLA
jgi:hypothetical protein